MKRACASVCVLGMIVGIAMLGCSQQPAKTPAGSKDTKAAGKEAPKTTDKDAGKANDPPVKATPVATDTKEPAATVKDDDVPKQPSTEKPVEEKKSASNPDEKKMSVTKRPYGKLADGTEIDVYTLTNAHGLKVEVINYGATITRIETPDRNGKMANITLYRDSLAGYTEMKDGKPTTPYFGSAVGRYANRIAKGRFTLDGKEYKLATNNEMNHLHGGLKGFDKVVWKAEPIEIDGAVGVGFDYTSPDGEEGYPGALKVRINYILTDRDELQMAYEATTDKATVLNLTNHTYWNLAGAGSGDVLGHVMHINADRFLPIDDTLIPLGEPKAVKGTAMDFTGPKKIGQDMNQVEGGYDHCYVLNKDKKEGELSLAARVVESTSGRVLEIYTTQPAIQFYGGNFLDGSISGGGKPYEKHYGFCLETQHYPDSPNKPEYPTTVLKPGETYKQTTVHKFGVEK